MQTKNILFRKENALTHLLNCEKNKPNLQNNQVYGESPVELVLLPSHTARLVNL